MSDTRKIVVTAGDVAGCSPWLALELLNHRARDESYVIVGPPSLRGFLLDRLDGRLEPGIEWFEVGEVDPDHLTCGEPNRTTGEAAFRALKKALSLSIERFDGLLTLPLSKASVQSAGHPEFVGHTELLEDHFDVRAVMAFFGSKLNVALLTRHVPLTNVSGILDEELVIETVQTVSKSYRDRRGRPPSIALLGLNPHAGEDGQLGTDEVEVLEPAVQRARSRGIDVEGPYPADSFLPVRAGSVDVILACYHDQGLVPFKQRHFYDGVHATLGLPVQRVSPDHGIAADRAPSGDIDPTSTLNCLRWLRGEDPESGG